MTPPTCRVCGAVHWPREGGKFEKLVLIPGGSTIESRVAGLELAVTVLQSQVDEIRNRLAVTDSYVTPVTVTKRRAEYMKAYREKRRGGV